MNIDLRSDTVTKPSAGMLKAMMAAELGDDVMGEDPTVQALEEKLAAMFGMEAALFCPSGTMSNQIAIKCFTQPMEEVICDQTAHVYRYEIGGIAFHSACSVRLLNAPYGVLSAEAIEAEINDDDIHYPKSSLVVLENTVNKGGGSCYTLAQIKPIAELCKAKGLKLHLDGARLFNALAFTGDDAQAYGQYFDGISICLSKGLGAPVGSVLLASKEHILKARKIRKAFGGGMRQAGVLAAAGLYALEHQVLRLQEDHQHAQQLAQALAKTDYVERVWPVQTNIVLFDLKAGLRATQLQQQFQQAGIRCNATGAKTIRFVTHLDLHAADIEKACEIILNLPIH